MQGNNNTRMPQWQAGMTPHGQGDGNVGQWGPKKGRFTFGSRWGGHGECVRPNRTNGLPSHSLNMQAYPQHSFGNYVNNTSMQQTNGIIGPRMQNLGNAVPHMQHGTNASFIQNSGDFVMQHNAGGGGPSMQNNNNGPRMQNNIGSPQLLSGTNVWRNNAKCQQQVMKRRQVDQGGCGVTENNQSHSGYQIKNHIPGYVKQGKKNETTLKLKQKISLLQKQLFEKNKNVKCLTISVEELKDKTSELVKGNKHLVEVINKKNSELKVYHVELSNMKSEVKCAQKEVLNCLKEKMEKATCSTDTLEDKHVEHELSNSEAGEDVLFRAEDKIAWEHSSSLCKDIKIFLDFHNLSVKISSSIKKVLVRGQSSRVDDWELAKKEVRLAVGKFHGNVGQLLDDVTFVLKKICETENCLVEVENNIAKKQQKVKSVAIEVEDFKKKVDTIKNDNLASLGKVGSLLSDLRATEDELLYLKKTQRKLEAENKRIMNKLSMMASSINLKVQC